MGESGCGDGWIRVRRWVDQGAEMGGSGCIRRCCFVAESSMKPCFFELFLRFYITFLRILVKA